MGNEVPSAIDRLTALLERARSSEYIGEDVTQLEHALQSAHLADRASASEVEVLAALLHDVGHLCEAPRMRRSGVGPLGAERHEDVGADFLSGLGFGRALTELVRGHVEAKRYLVATRPGYGDRLSTASRHTLELQGGPMNDAERAAFEAAPDLDARLRVRSWDEVAKVPGLRVPDLESYLPRLEARLAADSRQELARQSRAKLLPG